MGLKVTHYDDTYVEIIDTDDSEVIYKGGANISNVIEALAFYFGIDDLEHEEKEMGEMHDPLSVSLGEDLDNEDNEDGVDGAKVYVFPSDDIREKTVGQLSLDSTDDLWEDDDED